MNSTSFLYNGNSDLEFTETINHFRYLSDSSFNNKEEKEADSLQLGCAMINEIF